MINMEENVVCFVQTFIIIYRRKKTCLFPRSY